MMHQMSEEHMTNSFRFVDSLDRSILGSFAVDRGLLVVEDSNLRVTIITPRKLWALTTYISDINVFAELLWWWYRSDAISEVDKANLPRYMEDVVPAEVSRRMDRLSLVADYPELHDYFRVGIWDVEFARSCAADGVDAMMASSL